MVSCATASPPAAARSPPWLCAASGSWDPKALLPDPIATLQATEQLVREGFQVLVYTSDDPIMARRLKQAGAASVMPAGSPIGSGQGILNANNLRIILEYLKAA